MGHLNAPPQPGDVVTGPRVEVLQNGLARHPKGDGELLDVMRGYAHIKPTQGSYAPRRKVTVLGHVARLN